MKDVSLDPAGPKISPTQHEKIAPNHITGARPFFLISKRVFDVTVALATLPMLATVSLILLILNPFWNRGSLFISQKRAGYDGRDFVMYKFRTMTDLDRADTTRGADDPLELARITPLGHWLRSTKVDEIPQVLNVLLGEMSVVGPRPELSSFVEEYRSAIPNYAQRWSVRPGMTGYAQVMQGYTESTTMVRRKTELDVFYIRNIGWKLDLKIIAQTFRVVFGSTIHGA